MKIDVAQTITNWDGSPFQIPTRACPVCGREQELSPPLTLRSVSLNSLGPLPEDKDTPAETKFLLFDLGMKVQAADVIELTAKEVAALQDRINKYYLSAVIVTQAHRMLEAGDSTPPKK